jgi:hypothetical protein
MAEEMAAETQAGDANLLDIPLEVTVESVVPGWRSASSCSLDPAP